MENKNTKELRGYKAGLKSKLMGAVAMLLVSAIMVSSATYAWFVLSTHPEVKGMSTTVGSNGALEIALLNNETGKEGGLAGITAAVGDSKLDVTKSNETWGNIVDLSNASYGLGNIKLYPAALNAGGTGSDVTFTNRTALLKYAKYGTDGRIVTLDGNTFAAKYVNATWQKDDGYGVRAIGTGDKADPVASALKTARDRFTDAMTDATSAAETALNEYGAGLVNMAMKYGMDDSATYSTEEIGNITDAKTKLQAVADETKKAIQYAYEAYLISTNQTPRETGVVLATEITDIKAALSSVDAMSTVTALIGGYEALVAKLAEVTLPASTTNVGWEDIRPAMVALLDQDTMTLAGNSMSAIKTAAKAVKANTATEDETAIIGALTGATAPIPAVVSGGAYSMAADIVDEYENKTPFSLTFEFKGLPLTKQLTLTVSKTKDVSNAYLKAAKPVIKGLEATGGGSEVDIQTVNYGYIVDLAFQTNIAGELQLQSTGVNRVSSDTSTATQGGGTLFTVDGDVDAAALAAMRVVFIGSDNKILAVGKFDAEATTDNNKAYALHLYDYTFANDVLTVGNQKAADTITTLTPNTPVAVSALVYLDGNSTSYAQGGIKGTLNLQFKHSADLNPMVYDFSAATTGGSDTGDDQQP